MRRILFLLLTATVFAAPKAWVVTPGKGVGPITAATKRPDLEALKLPEGQLQDGVTPMEGGEQPTTDIWAMEPKKRLTLVWRSEKRDKLVSIMTVSPLYRTALGVGVGSKLSELEKLNGKPFVYLKFDGEAGGSILDWQGGKLAGLKGLTLVLTPKTPGYNKLTGQEKESLESSGTLRSDHPLSQRLNPAINFVMVHFFST